MRRRSVIGAIGATGLILHGCGGGGGGGEATSTTPAAAGKPTGQIEIANWPIRDGGVFYGIALPTGESMSFGRFRPGDQTVFGSFFGAGKSYSTYSSEDNPVIPVKDEISGQSFVISPRADYRLGVDVRPTSGAPDGISVFMESGSWFMQRTTEVRSGGGSNIIYNGAPTRLSNSQSTALSTLMGQRTSNLWWRRVLELPFPNAFAQSVSSGHFRQLAQGAMLGTIGGLAVSAGLPAIGLAVIAVAAIKIGQAIVDISKTQMEFGSSEFDRFMGHEVGASFGSESIGGERVSGAMNFFDRLNSAVGSFVSRGVSAFSPVRSDLNTRYTEGATGGIWSNTRKWVDAMANPGSGNQTGGGSSENVGTPPDYQYPSVIVNPMTGMPCPPSCGMR